MQKHSIIKRSIFMMIVIISFFIGTNASAEQTTHTRMNSVAQGLRKILSARYNATIGVIVQSLQTNRVYFSRNANQLFSPASVQKLITTSAALLFLKPDFQFKTTLQSVGFVNRGVLNGDLYVKFSGDPTFKKQDLFHLFSQLKSRGVQEINGNIVIDDTAFDHIPYPPGWAWDDLSYDYAAPLNTIIIDRNRFGMRFIPSETAGAHAILKSNLPNSVVTIFNHVRTTRYNIRNCPMTIYSNDRNQYAVHGCLAQSTGMQARILAIRDLLPLTQAYIRQALAEQRIFLQGQITEAPSALNAVVLVEHDSPPLKTMIIHLLKKSDNLYANALLKKMGELYFHESGGWQNGLMAEKAILKQNGLDIANVHLNDGAGLSRYNFVTPIFVAQILWTIHHHPVLKKYLTRALPIAGDDGTLAFRMTRLRKLKCLRAKTGSLTNVSSLAGFVQTKNHGLLSFVIIVNNFIGNRAPYIHLENRIGEYLYRAR